MLKMRKLQLRNAKLELLTENKVSFIGELKGYIQRWSMTIIDIDRYYDLLQLDKDSIYNIWLVDDSYRFIVKE